MRIKRDGPLGGRKAVKSDADKIKYYLVCEGEQTEPLYFEALNRGREKLGVHPRMELLVMERGYSERRFSNPQTLLQTVRQYLEEIENGVISYQEVIDCRLPVAKRTQRASSQEFSAEMSRKRRRPASPEIIRSVGVAPVT